MVCDEKRGSHERFLLVQTTPFNFFNSRASHYIFLQLTRLTLHLLASRRPPAALQLLSRAAQGLRVSGLVCGGGVDDYGFWLRQATHNEKEAATRDSFSFRRRHSNFFNSRASPLGAGLSLSASLPSRHRSYSIKQVFAVGYTWRQLSGAGYSYEEAKTVGCISSLNDDYWKNCKPWNSFSWDSQSIKWQ